MGYNHDEVIRLMERAPLKRQIIQDYGEIISQKVSVYTLEEIIAEKMRAMVGCIFPAFALRKKVIQDRMIQIHKHCEFSLQRVTTSLTF